MEERDKQTKRKLVEVVLVGPESSGKSTLAKSLAAHYNTVWVSEYLREFAAEKLKKNEVLEYEDNIIIAGGQLNLVHEKMPEANGVIFLDTDILQTVIYSYEYYGKVQQELLNLLYQNKEKIYFLLKPDIKWVSDPLRDRPNKRDKIFEDIKSLLDGMDFNYHIISGKEEFREKVSIELIDEELG